MHRALLSALAALVFAAGARAGDRMQPIPLEQMTPEQKRVADAIVSGPRKTLSGPFNAWLRSPELADRLQRVGEFLRFNTSLDHRLNEFAILITGQFWSCQYEWYAHYPLAIKAGLKPEVAAELAQGKRPSGMQEDEAIVYDFSTQLHRNKNVDDATYQAAIARLGEQGVMDLIAVNGYYDVVAMTLNVAQVMPPAGATPLLPPPSK
ncbi:MAG: carboxymuconolactone decarboxylase family protein [Xanthobacteraceae bacterium]